MHRPAALALLLIFLGTHLALLPRTLEDVDSINFALGVRHFDVERHQPHPPGYPVYIALAKASTAVLRAARVDDPAVRGLAIWSALAGTAAIAALFALFAAFDRRNRVAWWAAVVAGTAPLFWFTALRPLSDMTGLAFAVSAQALIVASLGGSAEPRSRPNLLFAGAFVTGFATGVRVQTSLLTVPLLVMAVLWPGMVLTLRQRVAAIGLAAVGVLTWSVPMLIATGGLTAYLHALGAQAEEDFAGVVMLWTHRTTRVAVSAVLNTFVWPWGWTPGLVVCALAVAGAIRIAWRAPRTVLTLMVAFVPYVAFHLLFHETETVRYALPVVGLMAYLSVAALDSPLRQLLPAGAVAIAVASLALALPASRVYARDGAPAFRVFDEMAAAAHTGSGTPAAIGMHAEFKRAADWASPILPARVARAPHGRECLTLVALWQAEPSAHVWFVADPDRTDLALLDPRSRRLTRDYRWGFIEPPFVGGARPDNADWYAMEAPGWMLDRGWGLTAEVAGVTARDGLGPHVSPAIAWLKSRGEETLLIVGGRNLGSGASSSTVRVMLRGHPQASWTIAPGFFLRRLTVPAGALEGSTPYVPLEITAESPRRTPVALEQFDAAGPAVPMFGFDEGWYEPEYNPTTGREWRWTSERALLWVRPLGRPVTLTLSGESPRRYFDAAPAVTVSVGDAVVSQFAPSADFRQTVALPADLLARASGRVSIQSSRFFVPGAGGSGDQRHLALRIYRTSVD